MPITHGHFDVEVPGQLLNFGLVKQLLDRPVALKSLCEGLLTAESDR